MDKEARGDYDPLAQPQPQAPPPNAEQADYQATSQDVANMDRGVPPDYHKKDASSGKILKIIALLIVLVLAGAAAYWFLLRPKPASNNPPAKTETLEQTSAATASKITDKTKSYTSSNFNLAFNYPEDWTVSDTPGTGVLTVKSPNISLKNANSQAFTGQVVMTIRDKSQKLTEFDKGNALATRDSEKVAYTKPSQTQRGNTYLSFLQYANSAKGLDGVYITGDNGYKKDQAIPLVDVSKVDPVISVTFLSGSGKPAGVADISWDDADFSGPLKAMLQSLSIN